MSPLESDHEQAVQAIASRLSLRDPQRDSLAILARLCEILKLTKEQDIASALAAVKAEFPTVTDFEREFPSACFSLATGVGKTRLMGAFIAYLLRVHGIKHFFVVAPNLTIYEKLIADFTPGTPKYVFAGISEFAVTPPEIVTGDNYESGRATRRSDIAQMGLSGELQCQINIFNISKINERSGGQARMRKLNEVLGQSYFNYLASLPDLVVLMDESHHYRAQAGMKSINELKPILGLEVTATPHVERGAQKVDFRNVLYDFPLAKALDKGYVKEPAVVGRRNFKAEKYAESDKALEELKLEDAAYMHERTKTALDVFARDNNLPRVKPFVLVVAQDTEHARELRQFLDSEAFKGGHYKGKVIEVHSGLSAEEDDKMTRQLIEVEKASNPVEWVVHVNKLKEGWDVTNLYTIVPLRAANSVGLVEQTIGRGLRLPYGRRLSRSRPGKGDGATESNEEIADTLNIISHDKFQEIVDYARQPNSVIRKQYLIDPAAATKDPQVVEIKTRLEHAIANNVEPTGDSSDWKAVLRTPQTRQAALATFDAIREINPTQATGTFDEAVGQPAIHAQLVKRVLAAVPELKPEEAQVVVNATIHLHAFDRIDIPKVRFDYSQLIREELQPFKLNLTAISPQPVSEDILQQFLANDGRKIITSVFSAEQRESRLEDYIIHELVVFDEVNYDTQADLLYNLAGQVVQDVKGRMSEDEALSAIRVNAGQIARAIHAQMQEHVRSRPGEPKAVVLRGFQMIYQKAYSTESGLDAVDFRRPVPVKSNIKGMLFNGFQRNLFTHTKFDSDPERRMAVIIEQDRTVEKWFRPSKRDLQIEYRADDHYTPDFIVECKAEKYMIEVKADNEMADPDVRAKAKRASEWCHEASTYELTHKGKPWQYLLVPESACVETMDLHGLRQRYVA